jgi:hypothetical protein
MVTRSRDYFHQFATISSQNDTSSRASEDCPKMGSTFPFQTLIDVSHKPNQLRQVAWPDKR